MDCNDYINQFWARVIILKPLLCIQRDPKFHIWYTYQQWGPDLRGWKSSHFKQHITSMIYHIVHIFTTEVTCLRAFMNGKSRLALMWRIYDERAINNTFKFKFLTKKKKFLTEKKQHIQVLYPKKKKQHIQVRTSTLEQDSITFQLSNSFANTCIPFVEIPSKCSPQILGVPKSSKLQ